MKKALITLDSTSCTGRNFDRFCSAVKLFQEKNIIPNSASIASIYHAALTPLSLKLYAENRLSLIGEALQTIKLAAKNRFYFESARVLHADSSASEDHVEQLSKYAKRIDADILVSGSSDRSGLPYWFLGSFSETAALRANLPVLIFKPFLHSLSLSKDPKFILTVDVAALPSGKIVAWIAEMAKKSEASLQITYVIPKYRLFLNSLQKRKSRTQAKQLLEELQSKFVRLGVPAKIKVLDESKSIAHTITNFADESCAWMIITTAADRSTHRKLVLGSRARHILALTKRPFLSVRLD